nr:MAG TPA: hypothetical protein [Bacteriophage sp.]
MLFIRSLLSFRDQFTYSRFHISSYRLASNQSARRNSQPLSLAS